MNQLPSPLPSSWRERRPIVLASMYLKFGPIFNFPGTTAQHTFEVTHHRVKKVVVASTEYTAIGKFCQTGFFFCGVAHAHKHATSRRTLATTHKRGKMHSPKGGRGQSQLAAVCHPSPS